MYCHTAECLSNASSRLWEAAGQLRKNLKQSLPIREVCCAVSPNASVFYVSPIPLA